MCGCVRPNEKFSGKGHRIHVCKDCSRLPKDEFHRREVESEIAGFLRQSNISERNLARLSELATAEKPEVAELARVVLGHGKVKPHKRKRLSFLARNHRDLLLKLEQTGLIWACRDP
jgi:hypothetical protein